MTLVVACYTADTPYEDEANLLAASLDQVGMEYAFTPYESRGDWHDNTAHKAEYLRATRSKRDGPLLYVDVDTFFHENCEAYFDGLAAEVYDFGAHWWRGPAKGHDWSEIRDEGWWMLSTTMFLGDTPGCRQLLDNWCALNDLWRERGIREGGGQRQLWFTVACMMDDMDLRVAKLPNRFNYIFDKSPRVYPDEPCIIEHTIASRENRDSNAGKPNAQRREKIEQLKGALDGV